MLYKPDIIDWTNVKGALTIMKANWGKLERCDEEAKKRGTLVGRIITHPFADGKAVYQITADNGKTVHIKVCTGIGDDWTLPAWGEECEISKDLARRFIDQRERIAALFK